MVLPVVASGRRADADTVALNVAVENSASPDVPARVRLPPAIARNAPRSARTWRRRDEADVNSRSNPGARRHVSS